MWQPIETAPIDSMVLLFCPERHFTNRERIEIDAAYTSNGTKHAWATHWAPLPSGPPAADVEIALAREADAEYHCRMAEEEYNREMDATHR
jgi:hypothetical protein